MDDFSQFKKKNGGVVATTPVVHNTSITLPQSLVGCVALYDSATAYIFEDSDTIRAAIKNNRLNYSRVLARSGNGMAKLPVSLYGKIKNVEVIKKNNK